MQHITFLKSRWQIYQTLHKRDRQMSQKWMVNKDCRTCRHSLVGSVLKLHHTVTKTHNLQEITENFRDAANS
jgi:hypothetical protein